MEEQMVIEIPNFSDPENSVNGHAAIPYDIKKDAELKGINIIIFPNGNTPEKEGYVTIVFFTHAKIDVSYMNYTVSVVDADGRTRYPQSFGLRGVFEECSSFGDVSFARRCVVLDPDNELLHEDKLTLKFDFSWDINWHDDFVKLSQELFSQNLNVNKQHRLSDLFDKEPKLQLQKNMQPENNEFYSQDKIDETYPSIFEHPFVKKLRCDVSHLCDRIRDKPKYYESLFREVFFEEDRHHVLIVNPSSSSVKWDIHGYIFNELKIFLRQANLDHVVSVDKCIALYYLCHKYGMLDLKEICRERLKCLLTSENAVEILDVARLCQDDRLRDYATGYILLNWKEMRNSTEWTELREKCPLLAKVVSRLANAIEVPNSGIEAGLRSLVSQYVLMNWNEVQKYTGLTPRIQKLIASCLRKDFYLLNSYEFVNSKEFFPVEEYKKHARDYDFYR